ncbi:MAG: uracil-DNA glycosylase [Oscillospiraceae bacterium]
MKLGNDWDEIIGGEFRKPYYLALREFLKEEYRTRRIYPDMYDIFNALRTTPYAGVKAVILGQDPYHGAGQAHGLCFSVRRGAIPPPSLKNIFKELHADVGISAPAHGELTAWAQSGVLLLNTVLTVREGSPNSHKGKGWELFTDAVISALNARPQPMVFLLWGANARVKRPLLTNPAHLIIESAHPSPLSAFNGFFGSRPFSRTNAFLTQNNISAVDWRLPD